MVLGGWTSSAGLLRPRRPLPEGVQSATMALELIRTPELVDQIVWPESRTVASERAQMARAIRIDFGFIPAYALFFALVGLFAIVTLPASTRWVGVIAIGGAMVAALFDIRENLAMLDLLNSRAGPLPRPLSLVKWTALFVTLGCDSIVLVDLGARPLRRWIGILSSVFAVAGAVEGLWGVAYGNDKVIEAAMGRLASAFPLAIVFFATRETLRQGLLPALERLAHWPAVAWLANWTSADQDETIGPPV